MRHKAFTLIELIVVITIIGILVGFLVVDFNRARRQQELDLMVQQTIALMETARASVDSGKISEDGDYKCLGGVFQVGRVPVELHMNYDPDQSTCDVDTAEFLEYGFVRDEVTISKMDIAGEQTKVWAMFVPPEADLVFYNGRGMAEEGGTLRLQHERNDEMYRDLNFSTFTNQVSLIDEES